MEDENPFIGFSIFGAGFFRISIELELELPAKFVEDLDVRLHPRMEEVGQAVMLSGRFDEGVLLEYFDVVLDRPVLDAQAFRELVHVSRLDPQGLD